MINKDSFKNKSFIILFFVLLLVYFPNSMTRTINHDEHMFVTAGVLAQKNTIYKDFGFVQMPYLPIIYGVIYKLTGTSYYLFFGRMLSLIFIFLSAFMIYLISFFLTKERFFSSCMVLLFLLNEITIHVSSLAWNSVMPIAFSLAAYYFFIFAISSEHINRIKMFLCGVFLAFAIGVKLYYVVMLPPFLLISLLYPNRVNYRKKVIDLLLPVIGGVMLGLLPVCYYIITNFDGFLFNNVQFHFLNSVWRRSTGFTHTMGLISKLKYAKSIFSYPSNIVLFIGFCFILFLLPKNRRSLHSLKPESLLSILIVLVTTAFVFIPSPIWKQYFAMPLPFFFIVISCLYCSLADSGKYNVKILLVCLIIVCMGYNITIFAKVANLINLNKWEPIMIHRISEEIKESIGIIKVNEKVATLSPLYAIESGMPIYNELASGPFLYRIGDLVSDKKRESYIMTSQNKLNSLFAKNPPKAIFVGFENSLDSPLIKYAQDNNYLKIDKEFNGGTLYVRVE